MDGPSGVSAVSRALVPAAALALLSQRRDHGYALVQRLRDSGFVHVRGGTLYPLLRGLEADGFVESEWDTGGRGPARKVFSVTAAGSAWLEREKRQVRGAFDSFDQIDKGVG